MSDLSTYIEAAMVQCPRCDALAGAKCWAWKCKHGRKGCNFAICAYKGSLSEPHLERAVAARKAAAKDIPPTTTRTVGTLTAADLHHTINVRDTSGTLRRVEHLPDGRSIIQVSAFPESFFANEPCEVGGDHV